MSDSARRFFQGFAEGFACAILALLIACILLYVAGCWGNSFQLNNVSQEIRVNGERHDVRSIGPSATSQPMATEIEQLTDPLLQLGPSTEVGAEAPTTQSEEDDE